jgi:hypothetical protein
MLLVHHLHHLRSIPHVSPADVLTIRFTSIHPFAMAPVHPSRAISQANILSHALTLTASAALAQGTAVQRILQPPSSPSSVPTTLTPMITFGVLATFVGITSLTIGFLQLRNAGRSSSDPTIDEGNDPVVDVRNDPASEVAEEVASNEVFEMRPVSRQETISYKLTNWTDYGYFSRRALIYQG